VPPAGLLPHRPGRAHPYLYARPERSDLLLSVGLAGRGGPAYQRGT
jgi:hypothetical protein